MPLKKLEIKKFSGTANTTNGSASVTNISDTSGFLAGDLVFGTGIPSGAKILTVNSSTAITLSTNATADGIGIAISVVNDDVLVKNADLLDGYHATTTYTGSTPSIVVRDSDQNINVRSVTFESALGSNAGKMTFSDTERLPQVQLSSSVALHVGGDTIIPIYNGTGSALSVGQVVYPVGTSSGYFSVALAQADDHATSHYAFGLVAESISTTSVGLLMEHGTLGGVILDPAVYAVNDILYLSPDTAGAFTNVKPASPDQVVEVGWVKKVSTNSSTADGEIFVKTHNIPLSEDISYDPTDVSEDSRDRKSVV